MNSKLANSQTQISLVARRTWGFRWSATDGVALLAFGAAAAALYHFANPLWWAVAIAASHFFLFCNVFRLARRWELLWALLFILNVGLWLLAGSANWFNVLACQIPVSLGVIARELGSARYHGILADRLNPKLKGYLNGQTQ